MTGQKRGIAQYKPLLLTSLLILLGFAVVIGIHAVYGDTLEEVSIGSGQFAFAPVYNRGGSWLHEKLDLGYRPGLLLAEGVVTLLACVFCIRFVGFLNWALGLKPGWDCWMYVMLSTAIARILQVLSGQYTLDYIYIKALHGTFDLFDFYLGIGLVGMVIWVLWAEVRYYRLKKRVTAGMGFFQKLKWELSFTGKALQAVFMPKARWGEKWQNGG